MPLMPKIVRALLAIVVGLVTWFAVATLVNFATRALLPGYAGVEKAMHFTLPMLLARLAMGAAASIGAGAACAVVARHWAVPAYALACALVLLFVPVHIGLWAKFPMWYHLVFLGSLIPLTLLGARLARRGGPGAA